jgi:hypothetical protein
MDTSKTYVVAWNKLTKKNICRLDGIYRQSGCISLDWRLKMMSLIHWFSAERRLEACERTILALGGSRYSDRDVPAQLAAQRDMIKYEIEYYKDQSGLFILYSIAFIVFTTIVLATLYKFGVL